MKPLPLPDAHHLLAAQGWLELGDLLEADTELEKIQARNRVHPDVLEIRWTIYSRLKKWDVCLDIASTILVLVPERPFGWIHRSVALHALKRTQEAYDQLLLAAEKFREEWLIPYHLACYSSVLRRFEDAERWIKRALIVDDKATQRAGIDDPDLRPLWDSLSQPLA